MKTARSRRARCGGALLIALALTLLPVPARAEDRGGATGAAVFYTMVESDNEPNQLRAHLGIGGPDAFREMLLWNPQLHNIYALTPGTRLRVPGFGQRPAFPAFQSDYSKWKIIGSHTSRFVGSPWERVTNIIVSANSVNNFFDNAAHPYIAPRDSLSLTYLLGEISLRTGYTLGKAIGLEDGELIDIPAIGGGICQLPSTVFPAAAKAGLDIVERTSHAYFPYFYWGYAEGFGFDARTGGGSRRSWASWGTSRRRTDWRVCLCASPSRRRRASCSSGPSAHVERQRTTIFPDDSRACTSSSAPRGCSRSSSQPLWM